MNTTTIFHVDGPLFRVLARWFDLVVLSLVWYVLAAPLVTAPVATAWLVAGVRRSRAGLPLPGPRATLQHLRHHAGAASRLALVHLAVAGLVVVALLGPSPGGAYGFVVLAVGVGVAITAGLVAPWSVVLLDPTTDQPVRTAVRAAYLRAMHRLPLAFLSAVAVAAGVAGLLFAPGWVRLVVLVSAPAAAAALVTWLCELAAPPATTLVPATAAHPGTRSNDPESTGAHSSPSHHLSSTPSVDHRFLEATP